jgi:D-threo-aldose 1-dehydrogenase
MSSTNPVERVRLGRTGLTVTRVGLGTGPGSRISSRDQGPLLEDVISFGLRQGINYFDTAPSYHQGASEEALGSGLCDGPRDAVVVATKVGRLVRSPDTVLGPRQHPDPTSPGMIFDFSRDGIRASLDESLRRSGLEKFDVAMIHDPDQFMDEAIGEAFATLAELKGQGVVDAIGAGMTKTAELTRFAKETDVDCLLAAGRYTLLDQSAIDELLPACQARHISVVVGGVFNSGVLAAPGPAATFEYAVADKDILERVRKLQAVCDRYDVPLRSVAIQFPIAHPAVATVLSGSRSPAHLADNMSMMGTEIPADLWLELRHERLIHPEAPLPI